MANTATPRRITGAIRRFAREIVPDAKPVFVRVKPAPGAEAFRCFPNVYQRVRTAGGGIQHGWAIREWPHVHLEAEFHAVWRTLGGVLLDVTPHAARERRIIFLSDHGRTYDFRRGGRIPSFFAPLSSDPAVSEYLSVSRELSTIAYSHTGHGLCIIPPELRPAVAALSIHKGELRALLIARAAGPNDPCPCGSGLKLKRCHGRGHRSVARRAERE